MNKKIKLIIITTIVILSVLLIKQVQYKNDELNAVNLNNKIDKDLVSILVNDGSNNYTNYEGTTFPSNTEYTLNSELSKCQDNNGNVIEEILSYETSGKVSIRTKKTVYCYLYFDKKIIQPNPPKLGSGMIPVYYDESDTSWHKADESNMRKKYKWYDYDNKMWANAVTVISTKRSAYQNSSLGTKIADSDINTMFVWIPRYKYTVWNYNADGTVASSPQEIQVAFESGTNKSGEITCTDAITGTTGSVSETCKVNNTECTDATCNGKTYTHPAFTFGSDELTGFWVGKFEPSAEETSTCYTSESKENCNVNTINLKIKPNVKSYRNTTVSTLFSNIAKMKNTGNMYGFATTDDTHMMKNSEWGAVAYFYYSKYGTCTNGTCTEMTLNSNRSYITGGDAYTTNINQTTTGNIYGVYDMSGGAWEYTMGNMVNSSGKFYLSSSGTFNPAEKYYDKYSYGTTYDDGTARKRGKLGDATKEVFNTGGYNWNSDIGYFTWWTNPWFVRGGYYNAGASTGAFSSQQNSGNDSSDSSRVVISIP